MAQYILPLKTRILIYHSFAQSHINYCYLVWGSVPNHIFRQFLGLRKGNEGRYKGLHTIYIQGWSHCWTRQTISKRLVC